MTAEVIDLAEYRQAKLNTEEYFQFHEDEDIRRRIKILEWFQDGTWAKEGTLEHSLVFPHGYNPIAHPEDSLKIVRTEATRRGII